jgi:hypothetical protein
MPDLQCGRIDAIDAAQVDRNHGRALLVGRARKRRDAAGGAEMMRDAVGVEAVGAQAFFRGKRIRD